MDKQFKKTFLTVLAVSCLLLTLGFLGTRYTMAAYTQKYMKAVAATGETQTLFSSNLLVSYRTDPGDDLRLISYVLDKQNASDGKLSIPFEIYNHPPQNSTSVNPNDVEYTLTVTAQGVTDLKNYVLVTPGVDVAFADGTASFTTTINGRRAATQKFQIQFPAEDLGTVTFRVKAAVKSGVNLNCLAAVISPGEAVKTVAAGVTGRFINPSTDDAYNYEITLTGEAREVTLTWPKNLEIEPFFEAKYGATVNGNSVTFSMKPGTILVNFYRSDDWNNPSWNAGETGGVTVAEGQ